MRRLPGLFAAAIGAVLCVAAPAHADDESPSPGAPTTSAAATPLERVSAYVQPSIAFIQIDWKGWVYDTYNKKWLNEAEPFELSFQCTGYFINPDGYIATAGHCVDPKQVKTAFVQSAAEWAVSNDYYANDLTVDQVIAFDDYRVEGTDKGTPPDRTIKAAWSVSAGGVQTSASKNAKVIKFQSFDRGDGAVLKIEQADVTPLALAATDDLEVGAPVVAIGYPGSVDLVTDADSFNPSYKEGSISSMKTVGGGVDTVYEISAAMSGGMSGGPTVDLEGRVVGFNSYTINGEQQAFNFIRPSSTIKALLADIGVTNELGEVGTAYRAGLDAYYDGDKAAAVKNFQAVLDLQPSHEQARSSLTKAKALPDPVVPKKDSSGFPVLWVGLGVVVLLIAGGLLGFLTLRRRGATAQPALAGNGPAAPGWGQQPPATPVAQPAPAVDGSATPTVSMPTNGQHAPAQVVSTPSTTGPSMPPPAEVATPTPVETTASGAPVMAAAVTPASTVDGVPAAGPVPLGFTAPAVAPKPAEEQVPQAAFCGSCGTNAAPGQAFCARCGQPLA